MKGYWICAILYAVLILSFFAWPNVYLIIPIVGGAFGLGMWLEKIREAERLQDLINEAKALGKDLIELIPQKRKRI